jgi:Holliday junction DNA helicase RuvA
MISFVSGTLTRKGLDQIEVRASHGLGYELSVPLTTFETLPKLGDPVALYTHLVVREDDWQLYGFATLLDRNVFRRLLGATGVGPALALGMLSTLSAERVVRAIREKDVATLQQVPRVGRKKAEQLILDLADKLRDIGDAPPAEPGRLEGAAAEDAIRALVALGFSAADAERAVRAAVEQLGRDGAADAAAVIRTALPLVRH